MPDECPIPFPDKDGSGGTLRQVYLSCGVWCAAYGLAPAKDAGCAFCNEPCPHEAELTVVMIDGDVRPAHPLCAAQSAQKKGYALVPRYDWACARCGGLLVGDHTIQVSTNPEEHGAFCRDGERWVNRRFPTIEKEAA